MEKLDFGKNQVIIAKDNPKVSREQGAAEPAWYVLKTKPNAEELVKNTFNQYSIEVYLPRLYLAKSSRKNLKTAPLFPGYLFFRLEMESKYWTFTRWAPGVSYVLNDGSVPTTIPTGVIEEIKFREEEHRLQKINGINKAGFNKNDLIKIVSGPLAGLEAVFEGSVSSNQRVQVLVQILGRLTSIRVPQEALELAT